jgi:hypothetical protein
MENVAENVILSSPYFFLLLCGSIVSRTITPGFIGIQAEVSAPLGVSFIDKSYLELVKFRQSQGFDQKSPILKSVEPVLWYPVFHDKL